MGTSRSYLFHVISLLLCAILSIVSSQNAGLNNHNMAGYGGLNGLGLGNGLGLDGLGLGLANLGVQNGAQQVSNPGLGYGLGE